MIRTILFLAVFGATITASSDPIESEYHELVRQSAANREYIASLQSIVAGLSHPHVAADSDPRFDRFGLVLQNSSGTNSTVNDTETWVEVAAHMFDAKNVAAVNLVFTFVSLLVAVILLALAAHLRQLVANRGGSF
eukprot:TRINITY_DN6747_c0_g2_i1.p1 TRINITY_DN6747_c0_g2~~TRINITY_DN6747_c0_g2_i1.p1  ORF type:complete len:136 (-),score=17.17 TRINITY_DN6747_c0_g2_i1:386-793(-)